MNLDAASRHAVWKRLTRRPDQIRTGRKNVSLRNAKSYVGRKKLKYFENNFQMM